MTFQEFILKAEKLAAERDEYRRGQAYFNLLVEVRPDLSEQVRTTVLDPFYRDENIKDFLAFVGERWDYDAETY